MQSTRLTSAQVFERDESAANNIISRQIAGQSCTAVMDVLIAFRVKTSDHLESVHHHIILLSIETQSHSPADINDTKTLQINEK